MRFNIVVANPPFSLDKWGADEAEDDRYNRFWRGMPPKSKGDYAFITHMIETALPQDGPRGGDRAARRAVPRRRRRPHPPEADRGEPAGRRDRPAGQPVLRHRHPGRDPGLQPRRDKGGDREAARTCCSSTPAASSRTARTRTTCATQDIEKIVDHLRRAPDRGQVRPPRHAGGDRGERLQPQIPRYVDTFEEEEEIDIAAVQKEIERLEGELAEVRGADGSLPQGVGGMSKEVATPPSSAKAVSSFSRNRRFAAPGTKTNGGSPSLTWSACSRRAASPTATGRTSSASWLRRRVPGNLTRKS